MSVRCDMMDEDVIEKTIKVAEPVVRDRRNGIWRSRVFF
jgi:hypothetical protein